MLMHALMIALMRGFYLDNFALSIASHFVILEVFTSGFGIRLRLFQPGKKIREKEVHDLCSYS